MATLNSRIQLRNDSAARWEQVNPVLYSGEFGFEKDTGLFKVGNGVTAWNSLPYANNIYDYDASQLFLSAQHKIGLRNYGKNYYKAKVNGGYELVTVDEEHPWKAGLMPRIAEEAGELVLAWFEADLSPAAAGVSYAVVESLPEVGANNVVYLVKDNNVTSGDAYKEYLYMDGAYVQIGDTSIDLNGYVKEVDEVLFDIDENDTLVSAVKELIVNPGTTSESTKTYQVIGELAYYDCAALGTDIVSLLYNGTTVLNYSTSKEATEEGIALIEQIGTDAAAGKYAKQVLVAALKELTIVAAGESYFSVDLVDGAKVQHVNVNYDEETAKITVSFIDHIQQVTDLFQVGEALELVVDPENPTHITLDVKKVDGNYIFENGGSFEIPVATEGVLGGVLSNNTENGVIVSDTGLMTVNTLNVDKLVGDLDLDCGGANTTK